MLTASESRAALTLVTGAAVAATQRLIESLSGSPEAQRAALLEATPEIIAYFTEGTAALAADFYDDERERASARGRFTAEPVIPDRARKIGNAIAWASEPLFEPSDATILQRLAPVVQIETARGYRETITTNQARDDAAVGWRRVARGDGCKFCRMLADKGAIFKKDTARFASHGNCNCSAAPVFDGQDGTEASVLQYVASQKRRSQRDRERLREYLAANY